MTRKHILDPEKVSKVLNVNWKHNQIPDENDEYEKVRYDKSSYIFNLPNKISLVFFKTEDYEEGRTIHLNILDDKFIIDFGNITGIKYLYKYKILILESKQKDCFSQLWISYEGIFRIRFGIPNSFYKQSSWIILMGDGKDEEVYKLQTQNLNYNPSKEPKTE